MAGKRHGHRETPLFDVPIGATLKRAQPVTNHRRLAILCGQQLGNEH